MKIFLAGIMQGSHVRELLHEQQYRDRIKSLLAKHLPNADVYDPLANHQGSLSYDDDTGKQVFLHHNRLCSEVDVVLAFVPQASMGTAIEMWEAHTAGRRVVTISPMKHNWAVKFLSDVLYDDITAFEEELASGRLDQRLRDGGPASSDK